MDPVRIVVEVHCLQLDCQSESRYRLYANNDLLTERLWRWNIDIIIEEEIWLNLNINSNNIIRLEPILPIKSTTKFQFNNFKIMHEPINITSVSDLAVRFII